MWGWGLWAFLRRSGASEAPLRRLWSTSEALQRRFRGASGAPQRRFSQALLRGASEAPQRRFRGASEAPWRNLGVFKRTYAYVDVYVRIRRCAHTSKASANFKQKSSAIQRHILTWPWWVKTKRPGASIPYPRWSIRWPPPPRFQCWKQHKTS